MQGIDLFFNFRAFSEPSDDFHEEECILSGWKQADGEDHKNLKQVKLEVALLIEYLHYWFDDVFHDGVYCMQVYKKVSMSDFSIAFSTHPLYPSVSELREEGEKSLMWNEMARLFHTSTVLANILFVYRLYTLDSGWNWV